MFCVFVPLSNFELTNSKSGNPNLIFGDLIERFKEFSPEIQRAIVQGPKKKYKNKWPGLSEEEIHDFIDTISTIF